MQSQGTVLSVPMLTGILLPVPILPNTVPVPTICIRASKSFIFIILRAVARVAG
jgi:hypothetical protein